MNVKGYITRWEENVDTTPEGEVRDVQRTVTFVFSNGRAGTVVRVPWDGPAPDLATLREQVWTLSLTPDDQQSPVPALS